MVWSVRNAVHGGVLRALDAANLEVHVVMPPCDASDSREVIDELDAHHAGLHPLLAAPCPDLLGRALLADVTTRGFCRRHRLKSHDIYRRWFHRRQSLGSRCRERIVDAASRLSTRERIGDALEALATHVDRTARELGPIRRQLQRLAPDVIWSTVNVSGRETPYRLAARDLGIPVVTSILSFDNLTSRGPLPRDAHYTVWGPRMQAQLLRLYPRFHQDDVSITGTPQFDLHRQPELRWSRARTLHALGLPQRARYFLYAASHPTLTPEEPALVAALAARLTTRPMLSGHRLVVRPHPLDDPARWTSTAGDVVRLSVPLTTGGAPLGWAVPRLEDAARLTSSLAHANGCLNVASTMSLDAAVLDRPVICMDFTHEADAPRELLYGEYDADHFAPLVASGGLRVAGSWTGLLDLMESAVQAPERDRDLRRRMVEAECGPVDGHAAQRIARVLAAIAGAQRHASAQPALDLPRCVVGEMRDASRQATVS
jgi:hypothetical protein